MTSNPHNNILPTVGDNLELNCMVNISMTHMNTTQLHLILYHNDTGLVIARESITATFKSFTFRTPVNNVTISNAGTYTCIYYLSNSNPFIQDSDNKTAATNITLKSELNDSFNIYYLKLVPNPAANSFITLYPLLPDYEEGSNVTLSCSVMSPLIDIETITNIQWKYNDSVKTNGSYSDHKYTLNYTISNVELSDAGIYTCLSFFDTAHPYIKRSGTSASTTKIIVICECLNNGFVLCYTFVVKSSSILLIAANPSSVIYNIGSDVILCCSVILSASTSSVGTNVNIQWLNSSNHILHSYTGLNDYTEHTLNYTISNVTLSDAGQYKCSFFVSPVNSLNFRNSTAKTNFTAINVISKLHSIINDLWIISLIVPISRSLLLVSSLPSYIEFGNNVTLNCHVTSSDIDLKMRTKVNIKWIKDQTRSNLESDSWTSYEYDRNFPLFLNNVNLSDAGKYNCSYYLTSANDNPYVKSSVVGIGVTNVTVKSKFCSVVFVSKSIHSF